MGRLAVDVQVGPESGASTPTLVQHAASSANPVGVGIDGNDFVFELPNPVLAGNCLILGISYQWSSGRTVAVSDDNGNTWPSSPDVTANPGNSVISSIFVLPNANAGATTITVHFDGDVIPFQYTISEFRNIATASPISGSSSSAQDAGASLACGSFTPTDNDINGGNLIWSYFSLAQGASSNPTSWVAGASHSLLDADIAWTTNQGYPHASQYYVQTASAAINPGMTATGDTNAFNCLAVSLKAANAGTAPAAGIRIIRCIHQSCNVPPAGATWHMQIPTDGNLLVLALNENFVINVSGITDSQSNSYTNRSVSGRMQVWHTANSTPSNALVCDIAITGTPATSSVIAYDITGAHASPFDVAAGIDGTNVDNLSVLDNAPTITPTTSNGLIIAHGGLGQGPGLGFNTGAPAAAIWDCVTYAGEIDVDLMENADLKAHYYNPNTSAVHWNWSFTSQTSNTLDATSVAFKAA